MKRTGTPAKPAVRTSNLAESTYTRLRDEILSGFLRPNEMLVEEELAERLDVSRTPIRESLQRLARDGLIISHRRRWMVYEHSFEEIRQIYEIRAALEGCAARLAAERATPEQIDALSTLARTRIDDDSPDEVMVQRNERFHEAITSAAGNPRLAELIRRNLVYYFNRRLAPHYHGDALQDSQAQHVALVEAIEARDGVRAEAVVREHVAHALYVIEQGDRPAPRPPAARA